ncbi:hypothetical protein [Amycolatopsis pithecellobii]|uniref:Uncharacterized protein n=1 Tax=Amycolatopsis pithecellobii TaxID=664692 RepID=A0A6N7Z232_9PSEU|nr:hypothetical protein [Amycolatopsis pithecellobii]MTD53870.1 hypothetical protein [Amycolatopsis pithecellobii]
MSLNAAPGRYYTRVTLIQGYRETSPLLRISTTKPLICTLDEAQQLGTALMDAVRLGRR